MACADMLSKDHRTCCKVLRHSVHSLQAGQQHCARMAKCAAHHLPVNRAASASCTQACGFSPVSVCAPKLHHVWVRSSSFRQHSHRPGRPAALRVGDRTCSPPPACRPSCVCLLHASLWLQHSSGMRATCNSVCLRCSSCGQCPQRPGRPAAPRADGQMCSLPPACRPSCVCLLHTRAA